MAAIAAGALTCGWVTPAAGAVPSVRVTVLPPGTTIQQLAAAGYSTGLMSAGIGNVPADQTYLDISQGNRVADSLYDGALSPFPGVEEDAAAWRRILDRAESAPADIVPGLLGSALHEGDIGDRANPFVADPALIAIDNAAALARVSPGPGLTVGADLPDADEPGGVPGPVRRVGRLPGNDLAIVFAEPPPGENRALPIGIAGRGFDGNLTSDSTRTDGYVLSTDIAPTILLRFGLPIPGQMDGEPIRSEGRVDAAAIQDLADRMAVIPGRRAPVVIASLVAWILLATAVALLIPAIRRRAFAWLALAFAYMPLMLLAGAAIEPGALAEGLLVGFGAAALAAITVTLVPGWRGLMIACAITVVAYAIDVITGSELTKLSLLGPNPIYGARFFGIGNELEALIAVMVPVGVGAALSTSAGNRKTGNEGRAVAVFMTVGLLAAVVFAAGRFGADVGAAIVLSVGAAVAAVVISGSVEIHGRYATTNRHGLLLAAVFAAPVLVLGLVAFVDLVSGGNAQLTRSVLDAGGASDLADIAQRRLELSADDFAQAAANPLFWLVIAGVCACVARWRRIDAWLRPAPPARAGFLGACAAVAVGVLVNDSGATFLVLGTLALGASLAFAWAQAGTNSQKSA